MATQDELFTEARHCMVDSQIRPNRVVDQRVLSAMRAVPRERFLPPNIQALAYVDEDVPLGSGRFLMEPMVFARLLQAANLRDNEHVLVVGAGTGYSAAVLTACGCRVTALDDDRDLLALADAALPRDAINVTLVAGPLAVGWPPHAPYDLILAAQINQETGRILTAIYGAGRITQAVIGEATPFGLAISPLFDCATPPIPSLRKASVFAF
jgi:protein-L-isoaspartate(D-aspartate) O-methyltransferase